MPIVTLGWPYPRGKHNNATENRKRDTDFLSTYVCVYSIHVMYLHTFPVVEL